jgi:hypothetical protein
MAVAPLIVIGSGPGYMLELEALSSYEEDTQVGGAWRPVESPV